LPAPEALLFRLIMAMTEVAHAVEFLGHPTVSHAPKNYSVKAVVMTRV
jgi:hypothetical protein